MVINDIKIYPPKLNIFALFENNLKGVDFPI